MVLCQFDTPISRKEKKRRHRLEANQVFEHRNQSIKTSEWLISVTVIWSTGHKWPNV